MQGLCKLVNRIRRVSRGKARSDDLPRGSGKR
jgi:hypothetical protein